MASVISFVWAAYIGGADESDFYKLEIIEAFALVAYPAFLYFYYRSLTDERPMGWKDYLWLLPALLIGTGTALAYTAVDSVQAPSVMYAMSEGGAAARRAAEPAYRMLYLISVTLCNAAVRIELLVVLSYALYRYLRYRRRMDGYFSNSEGKSMENNRAMLWWVLLFMLGSIAVSVGRFYYVEHKVLGGCLTLAMAVISFIMGYHARELAYTAANLADEEHCGDIKAEKGGYFEEEPASKTTGRHDDLAENFERLMSVDRIFLQRDLRLDDVASMMRTNRTYISRMINDHYGLSFSEVVNRRRIAWAQELMRANPGMSQEQVAESSGFSHASAFSRMFRHVVGATWREWLMRNNLA